MITHNEIKIGIDRIPIFCAKTNKKYFFIVSFFRLFLIITYYNNYYYLFQNYEKKYKFIHNILRKFQLVYFSILK